MESFTYELKYIDPKLAIEAYHKMTATNSNKTCFIVGSLGQTNGTQFISSYVEVPARRNLTFTKLVKTYFIHFSGLGSGGCKNLITEIMFDTLHTKSETYAVIRFWYQ